MQLLIQSRRRRKEAPIVPPLTSTSYFFFFSFFLKQVQSVLRRHWNQYKIQFEHSFAHSDGLRSAYTVSSSFTDGQSFSFNHDCTSEHLNGKSFSEMEDVAFKPEKLYGWLQKIVSSHQYITSNRWLPEQQWLLGKIVVLEKCNEFNLFIVSTCISIPSHVNACIQELVTPNHWNVKLQPLDLKHSERCWLRI